ncbi:unnamed protein product [marine sediment metagenome]|uniref:Uncharacterized protein n=1 Tax=marine sediment metagenome TaxID=412755 RepID=X1GUF4_9ZZZZ
MNYNSENCIWLERLNTMNKLKEKILIKKEKLILSYLMIITSIFGIFFYTFIIVNGISFLVSILFMILGVSLIILLFNGKLNFLKKNRDKDMHLMATIAQFILSMAVFLGFTVNPYENAVFLIFSLQLSVVAVYSTLLYVKIREIQL